MEAITSKIYNKRRREERGRGGKNDKYLISKIINTNKINR